jgi:hypothetical protein
MTGTVKTHVGQGEHGKLVVAGADCVQNGNGEQGKVGRGPGPLNVEGPLLVGDGAV